MAIKQAPREAVPSYEQEQVSRGLLAWLNQYPEFPTGVRRFNFEFLDDDKPCMALSTIPASYILKKYHGGRDYMAQYQFKLIYRGQPTTDGDRLKMTQIINAIGDWASNRREKANIGAGKEVQRIVLNEDAKLFGRYENGDEDYQITMTMIYYSERARV